MFRRRAFNHALALEALRGAPGRPVPVAELLVALAGALRPGGQFVMVDMVATVRLDPADPMVRSWTEVEGRTPDLPTEAALSAALAELGFDVRVTEDITVAPHAPGRAGLEAAGAGPGGGRIRTGCAPRRWLPRPRCGCAA